MKTIPFLCAAVLGLAGCGNDGSWDAARSGVDLARGMAAKRSQPQPDIRASLTAETVALFPTGLMFAALPDRRAQGTLAPVTRNGASRTWITIDGISLTFRDGLLQATRGLGQDLMSTDLDEVHAAVLRGAPRAVRIQRYLDGESYTRLRSQVCDYRRAPGTAELATGPIPATHVTESCASPDREVENHYWIDRAGTIRKSVQWVGEDVGYLHSELLRE